MLAEDRKRAGWTVEQAARRLGVSAAVYREIENGTRTPDWPTWNMICRTFGWDRRSSPRVGDAFASHPPAVDVLNLSNDSFHLLL
jgi:DNA-binding XRE family transcriptional regulator